MCLARHLRGRMRVTIPTRAVAVEPRQQRWSWLTGRILLPLTALMGLAYAFNWALVRAMPETSSMTPTFGFLTSIAFSGAGC